MIGKLSGVCPIKLPFKIFLLSALDSLASLYLFFWRKKKKKRKNFLAAGVQTEKSQTCLALSNRPKESCCDTPGLPR